MIARRIGATLFGVTLALGGVAMTAAGAAAATDPTPPPTENTVPADGGPVTVNVPGVGTVSFTIDPATGAITDVVVSPIDGVTAGEPVVTAEGVRIQVTLADGTVSVLEIEASRDDQGFEIETEIETGDDGPEAGGDNSGTGRDDSGEHGTSPNSGPGNAGEDHSGPAAGSHGPADDGGSGSSGGSGDEGHGGSGSGSGDRTGSGGGDD
jgi:uncharacterized membrane protein YgcG